MVRRGDLRQCRVVAAPGPPDIDLPPGQIVLGIDKFGFSSNNITYAALGDAMRYWDFFPAPDGWGRVTVWGFGDVVCSAHDAFEEGERVFGYLPTSTHLVLAPAQVTDAWFVDAAPHRAELPSVYQRYSRVAGDPGYDPGQEDQLALWRPLFMTSFGAAEFLLDSELFGASRVVFSSASSKTAMGVAFLLSRREPSEYEVVGLTSARNVEFCERVGYYGQVLPYEQLGALAADTPTLFVDFAGDGALLHDVHHHFGDDLKYSCGVGFTHWEDLEAQPDLPGPKPQFFFLPAWLENQRGRGFGARYGAAQREFFPSAASWMRIERARGPEAVEAVYREMLEGNSDPAVGHMLSLA
ncbi:MAG TPA: DUF2855 family protein [Thermoleophilaceae bacterium]|nr:DUF2855 family protein [Thermoleophilaceae bacterium]